MIIIFICLAASLIVNCLLIFVTNDLFKRIDKASNICKAVEEDEIFNCDKCKNKIYPHVSSFTYYMGTTIKSPKYIFCNACNKSLLELEKKQRWQTILYFAGEKDTHIKEE